MSSQRGIKGSIGVDLWSEIVASEEEERRQKVPSSIAVLYKRRKPTDTTTTDDNNNNNVDQIVPSNKENIRVSLRLSRESVGIAHFAPGRTSIVVSDNEWYRQLRQKEAKQKPKRGPLKRKIPQPPICEKERLQAYFQEVDSFELPEESPSPKHFGTWAMGIQTDEVILTQLCSRLGKWLACRKLEYSCGSSRELSKILETPRAPLKSICSEASVNLNERTPEKSSQHTSSSYFTSESSVSSDSTEDKSSSEEQLPHKSDVALSFDKAGSEDLEEAIKRLSLSPQIAPSSLDQLDPYLTLLGVCKQSAPLTLLDVLSQYSNSGIIVKVGEGTFGEAFKAGSTVCKIVPFDGDLRVNGEVQKRSAELLEEALLSQTLNCIRGKGRHVNNACTTFIETLDIRVCQGPYDPTLIKAWEDWDAKHESENDHPKEFSDKQCYVVFVLAHGGEDLENYVLGDFDEARSLMVQVTAALAVAEAAYEFEHRDLHWGNILIARNKGSSVPFTLEGKKLFAKSFGLSVSIIDFTLSRIKTGESMHFFDLSSDPDLFTEIKGDKQSETYRKMRDVTDDMWEGSFPKTNVLWLQYLVDVLLLKKTYKRPLSPKNGRDLRSLKKHLNDYSSAKEAIFDPFFSDLLMDRSI